ncbi:type VII secretion target [Actinokineospora sp. NBRC 105648]|uniref:type VII secretion target n=1 Tax=Actinokineospora sp. NBRC 105648 TaxID=3032206 RepID=UPI0024A14DF2|nr:type VII secretion target [Actinokineospora sp. NBRC 105648]GLZ37562.1 hypothetical protein Acsp05_11870 [Actinokineospora sp. NBRC 105648]
MPDGYGLTATELDAHASHVDGVADQLNTALSAATAVALPTGAYGVICQFFPPLLDPVEQYGIDAITESVTAMTDNAAGIRGNAENYRTMESDTADAFDRGVR